MSNIIALLAREADHTPGITPHQKAVLKALVAAEQCLGSTNRTMDGLLAAWLSVVKTAAHNGGGVALIDHAITIVNALLAELQQVHAAIEAGQTPPNVIVRHSDVVGTPEGSA